MSCSLETIGDALLLLLQIVIALFDGLRTTALSVTAERVRAKLAREANREDKE
jgi:hypothetical protein